MLIDSYQYFIPNSPYRYGDRALNLSEDSTKISLWECVSTYYNSDSLIPYSYLPASRQKIFHWKLICSEPYSLNLPNSPYYGECTNLIPREITQYEYIRKQEILKLINASSQTDYYENSIYL